MFVRNRVLKSPVLGRGSWPGGPAAGHTAGGCIEGRTERMVTLQEEHQWLMQLVTLGVLQFHGQSVELLLILFGGKNSQHKTERFKVKTNSTKDIPLKRLMVDYLWSWGIFPGLL